MGPGCELPAGWCRRILVPAPWTRSIDELIAGGVRGELYAHELLTLRQGAAPDFLDALRDEGVNASGQFGLELVGAFEVAMVNESECIVIWAIPDWPTWAAFEAAQSGDRLRSWRTTLDALGADWRRSLPVDAPLAPLRIRRRPEESDRRPLDDI